MVVFTCNHCGASVKKNQVEKHYTDRCFNIPFVSCMDCSKDFQGDAFKAHTQCISEEEKYSAKGFTPKASISNNLRKREEWANTIKVILSRPELGRNERELVDLITNQNNIPQKKNKFCNFVVNAYPKRFGPEIIENVWKLLEEQLQLLKQKGKQNANQNNIDSSVTGNIKRKKEKKGEITLQKEQVEEEKDSVKASVANAQRTEIEKWSNAIKSILTNSELGKKGRVLVEGIINQHIIPKKKVKFFKLVNRLFPEKFQLKTIENVWKLLKEQLNLLKQKGEQNANQNNVDSSITGNIKRKKGEIALEREKIKEKKESAKASNPNYPSEKMEEWVNAIKGTLTSSELGKNERELVEGIINHNEIPKKKAKFCNFVTHTFPNKFEPEIIENVWSLLENLQLPNQKEHQNSIENSSVTENIKRKKRKNEEEDSAMASINNKQRKLEKHTNAPEGILTCELGRKEHQLVQALTNYNVSKKKNKFCKFVNNTFPNKFEPEIIENVWNLREKLQQLKQNGNRKEHQNNIEDSSNTENIKRKKRDKDGINHEKEQNEESLQEKGEKVALTKKEKRKRKREKFENELQEISTERMNGTENEKLKNGMNSTLKKKKDTHSKENCMI